MMISVIIPCFNEEKVIENTLVNIQKYFDINNYDYEIIVIDDKSTDASIRLVENYILTVGSANVRLLRNHSNSGKGYSVRRGFHVALGDYVLITDADLSTPISAFSGLIQYAETFDLVMGSRKLPLSIVDKKQSLLRRIYSKCFNMMVNTLFDLNISDTQCGFKLYNKKVINVIIKKSVILGFGFDVEHIIICKTNDIDYIEVPVVWNDNKRQSVGVKQIFGMFNDLALINRHHRLGHYKSNKKRRC